MKIDSYKITITFDKLKNLTENRKSNLLRIFKGYKSNFDKNTGIIYSDDIKIRIGVKIIEIVLGCKKDISSMVKSILKVMGYDINDIVSIECCIVLNVFVDKDLGKQLHMFSNIINLNIDILPLSTEFLTKVDEKLVNVAIKLAPEGLQIEVTSLEDKLKSVSSIIDMIDELTILSKGSLVKEIENVLLGDEINGTKRK